MLTRVLVSGLALVVCWAGPCSLEGAEAFVGSAIATGIMESFPNNNLGAVGWTPCGTIQNVACGTTNNPYACVNRSLIKFDLSSIPPGSAIKSVGFRVWVVNQPPNDETDYNTFFDFHRLFVPWGEGSGTNVPLSGEIGRPAIDGESNWYMRQSPSNAWAIPGGAKGIDFATNSSAFCFAAVEPGSQSDFPVLAISNGLVADVQFWLDHPEQNFGWLMKGRFEEDRWTAKRFMTIEGGIDDYPQMIVTYTPPPFLSNFQTNGSGTSFQFQTEPNQPYVVQYRDSLSMGTWTNLQTIPATPDPTNFLVIDPQIGTNAPQRFYRVIAPQ